MVAVLLVVFGSAVAILEYGSLTTVSLDIGACPHAYFVVAHGLANVTVPENQNAVVQVPQDTNITVYVFPDPSYQVLGWVISPPSISSTGENRIQFITGSDGSTIKISVTLSNNSSAS